MTKDKEEVLAEIRGSFAQGIELYNSSDLAGAEAEFVKTLRPLLSKPDMKAIHPENIEVVKIELLRSMYHLGEIYLRGEEVIKAKYGECIDHHSKAAAIFQYCAGFAAKYGATIEVEGQVADADYFLRKAYGVEKEFLAQVPDSVAIDWVEADFRQKNESYKAELQEIRHDTKERLDGVIDIGIEQLTVRAAVVEDVYRTSVQFFVDHQPEPMSLSAASPTTTSESMSGNGFVQRLLSECHDQLSNPPQGCDYSIVGLGSLALGTMTPWSDLEFAVLISEDIEDYKEYFRNLTKLLHIKMINLGETQLRSVGIESLNNFRTANEADDWFWDDVIESGFSFDGPAWHACKHPLGRQGDYQAARKEKNEHGVEVIITESKPDYELILTPQQLAAWQFNSVEGLVTPSFTTDKHLIQALRSVTFINGSQLLFDEYKKSIQTMDCGDDKRSILQVRAFEILKEDVDKFSLKLEEEEGKLIDVKKDIYRLGDRIVSALSNYHDIHILFSSMVFSSAMPLSDFYISNVWQMIDEMRSRKILSAEGAQHLKEALSVASELRLRTYANNEAQGEMMSTYEPAVEHLTEEARHQLSVKTFHMEDTSILHHFYYVMLRLQRIIKLCLEGDKFTQHIIFPQFLADDSLYEVKNVIKSLVHAKFLEYDKALEFMLAARDEKPENMDILNNLYFLYCKMGLADEASSIFQEIELYRRSHDPEDRLIFDRAEHISEQGNIHMQQGALDEAIACYREALDIYTSSQLQNDHQLIIAQLHSTLGVAHCQKGEFDDSSVNYEASLAIYSEVYGSDTNNLKFASVYINLGFLHFQKGEINIAENYYQKAFSIHSVVHALFPNHPSFIKICNGLGKVHLAKGEYDKAAEYFEQASSIVRANSKSDPTYVDMADNHNNLGNAYLAKGNYNQAIDHAHKALAMSSEPQIIGKSYLLLGSVNYINGDYDSALANILRIPNVANSLGRQTIAEFKMKTLVQLGNQALLADDFVQARLYYSQANPQYDGIDFYSVEFIELQKQCAIYASLNKSFVGAIRCQQVLIKVDPEANHGNHYHNLARLYVVQGDLEGANIAFLQALACPEPTGIQSLVSPEASGSLHARYAQFLILNRDQEVLSEAIPTISEHLYAAKNSIQIKGVQYSVFEKNNVCSVLSDFIAAENTSIDLSPQVFAYYLLIKYPEYIMAEDSREALFDTFKISNRTFTFFGMAFGGVQSGVIISHLLADAEASVASGQVVEVAEDQEGASTIDHVEQLPTELATQAVLVGQADDSLGDS